MQVGKLVQNFSIRGTVITVNILYFLAKTDFQTNQENLILHFLFNIFMFFICMIFSTILDFFYFLGTKSHLRRTSHKVPPKPETLAKIQDSKIWKMENEFYQFVRKQFRFVRSQTFQLVKGQYVEKSNRFHFEKIRPR